MSDGIDQKDKMKWILFLVFTILFVLIVLCTLAAMFFDFGNLQEKEREILLYAFIVEIGVGVVALFYSIFELKKVGGILTQKVRLNLNELSDIQKFIGKSAILSPSDENGNSLKDLTCTIVNDNGPFIPLKLPNTTHSVYVTVDVDHSTYSGSFVMGTHLVQMTKEENANGI